MTKINLTPTEAEEQTTLFQWVKAVKGKIPELELLFHIANEGKRSYANGAAMKQAGLRRGVPDLFLPVPREDKHGLFIELKRTKGSRVSADQLAWIDSLRQQNYQAEICYGWLEAVKAIEQYLKCDATHDSIF